MRRLAAVLALAVFLTAGCAGTSPNPVSMVSELAGNPLVSSLMSGLGLNANQAAGGAGALLGLAQQKMPSADWKKLADAIPGTKDLTNAAKSLGGMTGSIPNLAGLSGTFSKLGLNPDQVTKLVPAVGDYVGKAAGPDVASAFASAVK